MKFFRPMASVWPLASREWITGHVLVSLDLTEGVQELPDHHGQTNWDRQEQVNGSTCLITRPGCSQRVNCKMRDIERLAGCKNRPRSVGCTH